MRTGIVAEQTDHTLLAIEAIIHPMREDTLPLKEHNIPLVIEATLPLVIEATFPLEIEATLPLVIEAPLPLEIGTVLPLVIEDAFPLAIEAILLLAIEAILPLVIGIGHLLVTGGREGNEEGGIEDHCPPVKEVELKIESAVEGRGHLVRESHLVHTMLVKTGLETEGGGELHPPSETTHLMLDYLEVGAHPFSPTPLVLPFPKPRLLSSSLPPPIKRSKFIIHHNRITPLLGRSKVIRLLDTLN